MFEKLNSREKLISGIQLYPKSEQIFCFSSSVGNLNLAMMYGKLGMIDRAKEALESPFFTICPLSNIFIHRQLPPINLMRENGLKICLGTDSLSSNLILDMVSEMECLQNNFPGLELGEILQWACANGAELLGKEDTLGSIKEGKAPGIVLLENLKDFRITPETKSTRIA